MPLHYLSNASVTDPKFPILRDDEELNAGSLVLLDLTHSLTGVVGVPANGSVVRNIARQEAATLIGGVSDLSTMDLTFSNTLTLGSPTNMPAGTEAIFERTAKGALHGIISQTAQVSGHIAQFRTPTPIGQYLINNPTHVFGFSLRRYMTRLSKVANTNVVDAQLGNSGSIQANYVFLLRGTEAQVLGLAQNVKTGGWTGAPNAAAASNPLLLGWGSIGNYATLGVNAAGSFAFYRAHLCDLTAAAMAAADFTTAATTYFNKQTAPGGRWYGDVIPTAPAVLA